MSSGLRLARCACVLAMAFGASSAAVAQPVPTVASAAPAAAATPLETFDAAWRVLRDNYVAEKTSKVDWDALRAELRPRAEQAATDEEVRVIVRDMLERIGQSHFAIVPAPVASAMAGPLGAPRRPRHARLRRPAAREPAGRHERRRTAGRRTRPASVPGGRSPA